MTTAHTVPPSETEWLAAWKPTASGNGNFVLKIGPDVFTAFRDRGRWKGGIGRTIMESSWPSAEAAQRGLYSIVSSASAEQVDAWHRGLSAPTAPAATDDGAELLLSLPRGQGALRIERKSYEGHGYLSLTATAPGKPVRSVSVRFSEARAVADALRAAVGADQPADAPEPAGEPSYVPRGRPVRPAWAPSELPAPGAAKGGRSGSTVRTEIFDEFEL